MHEAEKLLTSSASEHGHETKGTRVKIPGVNIPESAQSIISVEVLAERVKQSSLCNEVPSNQVLAERVKQSREPSDGGKS